MEIKEFVKSHTWATETYFSNNVEGPNFRDMATVVEANYAGWMFGRVDDTYYIYAPLAISRFDVETKIANNKDHGERS